MSETDLHRRTAALMFEKPPAEVTERERAVGKTMNAFVSLCLAGGLTSLEAAAGISREEAVQLGYLFSSNVLGITSPTD